ncbi:MAG: hypothetical protein INQ03_05410 [Candidatus Heimdallarchaeota archaeon]|nr:hypothetical protein [Candidatus Heimdallarchaeota archaeon]
MKYSFFQLILFLLILTTTIQAENSLLDTRITEIIDIQKVTSDYEHIQALGHSYFRINLSVEVYNFDNEPVSSINFWAMSCGAYPYITGSNTSYQRTYENFYATTCTMAPAVYDPGITNFINIHLIIGFDANLTTLPDGDYTIYAPTDKGKAYEAYLHLANGAYSYELEAIPENYPIFYEIFVSSSNSTSILPLSAVVVLPIIIASRKGKN